MRIVLLSVLLFVLAACSGSKEPREAQPLDTLPTITPDYVDVTIPPQIAPLRFQLADYESGVEALAVLKCGEKNMVTRADRKGNFLFDEEDWKELLDTATGKQIEVLVYRKVEGLWQCYAPFHWQVAVEPADRYLAYRLIEPGYVLWNKMGIYQRDITTYQQKSIIENDLTQHNCMNCHTFLNRKPQKMLFHMRADLGGTYLIDNGIPEKVKLGDDPHVKSLVYPSWHPSGRVVAFSVNKTRQEFHRNNPNRVEVYDSESDIVLYDVLQKKVLVDSVLFSSSAFETFPHFSPDGKRLYFCSAHAVERMPEDFKSVKYNLCAIDFDIETLSFGTRVDTIYHSRSMGSSVSFPRVSPDGRFLMFTTSLSGIKMPTCRCLICTRASLSICSRQIVMTWKVTIHGVITDDGRYSAVDVWMGFIHVPIWFMWMRKADRRNRLCCHNALRISMMICRFRTIYRNLL